MSKSGGWAQYMRDHDIPAEGYPPPAMDDGEELTADRDEEEEEEDAEAAN